MMMNNNEKATVKQVNAIIDLLKKNSIDRNEFEAQLGKVGNIENLTVSEASNIIGTFYNNKDINETLHKIAHAHENDEVDSNVGNENVENEGIPKNTEVHENVPVRTTYTQRSVSQNNNKEMSVEKASSRPQLLAKMNNIPPELADMFFMLLGESLYIKQPGLLYMASKKGYARINVVSADDGKGGYTAEAKIYPLIPIDVIKSLGNLTPEMQNRIIDDYYGPTIGHGKANKENVKMAQMYPYFKELAETRAVNRALRLYTGYGGTSYEEMPEAENIIEPE